MIARTIEFCARNRLLVLLLTAFVVAGGVWTIYHIRLDAIPDLSDVQVIVFTEYPGQAPQVVEDQVTYPLSTALLAVPRAKVVRGQSFFGFSLVYVIFEDGTDLYWARSRVLEYLNYVAGRLPRGVSAQLGPDATGVGWVYQYTVRAGWYCPEHPQGIWFDPGGERAAPFVDRAAAARPPPAGAGAAPDWYETPADAPAARRDHLVRVRIFLEPGHCPLDGRALRRADLDLGELRAIQDWYLRYELTAVPGVAEVASVGGFVRQYQVVVDPDRLLAYQIPLGQVREAIRRANNDVGGRVLEMAETEYMVRGLGYLGRPDPEALRAALARGELPGRLRARQVIRDLEQIVIRTNPDGTPVYLRDLARVDLGPELRRGLAEANGQGEVVGGIVVMRFGENAHRVIRDVRARLAELRATLPAGVDVLTEYDRSALIERAVATLREKLIEEMITVAVVCTVFLFHLRSSFVAVIVIPTSVLASLILMQFLGINANIMSLGGIAIAIGAMVDSSVVMVENAHKHLERYAGRKPHAELVIDAAREVGPTLFFSLLIITVSFLPIFVLGEQSGRLFRPLAYTKTFAMAAAALAAVTLVPALMVFFIRGRIRAEQAHPVSRLLQRAYEPLFHLAMRGGWLTLLLAALLVGSALLPLQEYIWGRQVIAEKLPFLRMPRQIGSEFMPPLDEGDLLYMPTTRTPAISITKARELLQQSDALIATFPEVHHVFGKIGRAETATDPAPLNMIETTIMLEPDRSRWRQRHVRRWFSFLPDWLKTVSGLRYFWPEQRPITVEELISGWQEPDGTRVPGLDEVVRFPGMANSWTMPIRTRIDMLSTGIKTPVGIKVIGDDLAVIAGLAERIAAEVQSLPGVLSAIPDDPTGGMYVDFRIDREQIARYGLSVADVQDVILTALGGTNITWTVEGLERYPVNLRYPRELRDNLPALRRTLVATPLGAQVPLAQLAHLEVRQGAAMIKTENARKAAWVYVDLRTRDVGGWVARARQHIAERVPLPPGYGLIWSGQYEYIQAANQRLMVAVPATLVIIVLLLYLAHRSWLDTCVVLLAVPFSLVGAVWFMYWAGYDMSVAVWVGLIALAGLDAETGMVMLLYLHNSYERFCAEGRMRSEEDLRAAIHDGAVLRIRPKTMTVATTMLGLLPIMLGTAEQTGADTMKRIAAPMFGGLLTSFLMELLVYPVIFLVVKRFELRRRIAAAGG